MSHYKNSVYSTAQKTYKKQQGPTLQTLPDFQTQLTFETPSKDNYKNQIESIKNSIHQIIQEVSNKSQLNKQAVGLVKTTNMNLLESLQAQSSNHFLGQTFQNDKIRFRNNDENYPNYSPINLKKSSSVFYSPALNEINPESYFYEGVNNEQIIKENVNLRKLLNLEIKKNNEILKRCRFLELQNSMLKKELKQGSNSFYEHKPKVTFANQSVEMRKSAMTNSSVFISELEALKSQNQRLRRDAISLLQK